MTHSTSSDFSNLSSSCLEIRRQIIKMSFSAGGGQHLGGGLSMVELMVYIYGHLLNLDLIKQSSDKRDRFILSKGHGVLGFYPVLHHFGLISDDTLSSYKCFGSELISHPIKNLSKGIESSNGSLGHGLSYAAGIAHGLHLRQQSSECLVLLGDGECNEGSVWETALSVSKHKLNNLITLIDYNKLQSYDFNEVVLNLEPLSDKWKSFGFKVFEADGHNIKDIYNKISLAKKSKKQSVIIFHTIKGKGIESAENNRFWHFKANLNKDDIKKINNELTY